MKISQQPTNHILARAYTNSDADSCDFAIITCRENWAEDIRKRLDATLSNNDIDEFYSSRYRDGSADFYVSNESTADVLPDGQDWAFVELDEGEQDQFEEPEGRLDCYYMALEKNGLGFYTASGKYSGDEFYTTDLPLKDIIERMLNPLQ